MNTKTGYVFFFFVLSSCAYTQRDTLYLDSLSGDYVVRYWRTFAYGSDSAGMHMLEYDDMIGEGQEYVEKDSFVTVIFEPATKIKPTVSCTVSKDTGIGSFVYLYHVENGANSRQRLYEFEVAYGSGITVADRPPKDGWHSDIMYTEGGDKLVPRNRWMWFGGIGLKPGSGLTIGCLVGNGLPAMMPASFRGKRISGSVGFPNVASYEFGRKLAAIHSFDGDCVYGWSLGPVAIPPPFNYSIFLDSLISYRRQCVSLGWISNDSVAKSMDGKLRILRRDVAGKKYSSAVAVLRSLLRELEVHRSRSVSEDAYALFKYNAEYLSDRLAGSR